MIKNLKAKLCSLAFWKKGKQNMNHSAVYFRDISQREHEGDEQNGEGQGGRAFWVVDRDHLHFPGSLRVSSTHSG